MVKVVKGTYASNIQFTLQYLNENIPELIVGQLRAAIFRGLIARPLVIP